MRREERVGEEQQEMEMEEPGVEIIEGRDGTQSIRGEDGEHSAVHFEQRSTQAGEIVAKEWKMVLDVESGRVNVQIDSVKDSGIYIFL